MCGTNRIRLRSALVFAVALMAVGCIDTPFSPEATPYGVQDSRHDNPNAGKKAPKGQSQLTRNDGFPIVTAIRRLEALERPISVRQRIGPEGGQIEIEEVGLKVDFPPGALQRRTWITVTAPAGDLVGYHFEPSGTEFDEPVVVKQILKYTNAHRSEYRDLIAAYFQGPLEEHEEALEILPLVTNAGIAKFAIEHFSGYVIATN